MHCIRDLRRLPARACLALLRALDLNLAGESAALDGLEAGVAFRVAGAQGGLEGVTAAVVGGAVGVQWLKQTRPAEGRKPGMIEN